MIKTSIIIITFILFSLSAKAEDTTSTVPKHVAGVTAGMQYRMPKFLQWRYEQFGSNIFYRHLWTSDTINLLFYERHVDIYFGANAGYMRGSSDNVAREDITISVGPYFYLPSDWDFFCFSIGAGALHSKEKAGNTNSVATKPFIYMIAGFVLPLYNSINLEFSFKESFAYGIEKKNEFNLGFSYSF